MPVMQRRARDTRTSLLQAAREVFTEVGYADANVADIVGRAGSSVGSMYHHFGGKGDLYLALYDEHQSRQEERANAAVLAAQVAGERDPLQLFFAGARAFLRGCWEERDLAELFLAGGGPAEFDVVSRNRFREWVRRGGGLFKHGEETQADMAPFGEAYSLVLTTVIAAAGREVANQPSEEAAEQFADGVMEVLTRLAHS